MEDQTQIHRLYANADSRRVDLAHAISKGGIELYHHVSTDVARMLVNTRSVRNPERFDANFDNEFGCRMMYDNRFRAEVDGWVDLVMDYVDAAKKVSAE